MNMDIANLMYVIGTILILPAILFAFWAQFKVSSAFDRFSRIPSAKGITAAQLAKQLLRDNDCGDIEVIQVGGHLSDHYDPRKRVVALSQSVYSSTSLAALGIAAHEVGHAIQHHTKYGPLMLRQLVIKSTSLINKMLMPLIIIGLIASLFAVLSPEFLFVFIISLCVVYTISFIVNLITLPTEYNASSRAKRMLREGNYIYDGEEYEAVSKVLGAAALTYLASLIVSLAYMLRFVGLLMKMMDRR